MAGNATSNSELTSMVRLTSNRLLGVTKSMLFCHHRLVPPSLVVRFSQPLKIEPRIAIFRWIIISRFKQGKPLNRVDVTRRLHSLTQTCLWVCVFGQSAVDTSPCEVVVTPPFRKEPFAASWTGNRRARFPAMTKKTIHAIATTKAEVNVENTCIESIPTVKQTGT